MQLYPIYPERRVKNEPFKTYQLAFENFVGKSIGYCTGNRHRTVASVAKTLRPIEYHNMEDKIHFLKRIPLMSNDT